MTQNFEAVVGELGGARTFGRTFGAEAELRDAVRRGFPLAAMEELQRGASLTLKDLADSLCLPSRSLQRRRGSGRLTPSESDRLYRLARTLAQASDAFGERAKAVRWLKRRNRALGGIAPLAALDTEIGARQVENVLGRISLGGIS